MQITSGWIRDWFAAQARSRSGAAEPPLRAELFSGEQLARRARSLAAEHQVIVRRGSNRLLERLDDNERVLRVFNRNTLALDPTRRITPAAEWLLDNFYLIEEQTQLARRHLPRGYSRELPRLLNGPSAGLPRVYDIGLELISHVDAQIDAEPLRGFIAAYQTVSSLRIGELWAIPIMLRLGLIENLQRITTRLILAREDRTVAEHWVDRLQAMAEKDSSHLVVVVAEMAQSDLPISSSFVAEFCQRLSRQSPVLHLARGWLEQRLGERGLSIEQLVQQESQSQASDQVSVSHSISSLRFLSARDWKKFVEGLSGVEATLRTDPAGVYAAMDFSTRDRYRHAVEFMSRHGRCSESEVALKAVQLASENAVLLGVQDRKSHVGYYLVDQGQVQLGDAAGTRWPWRDLAERRILRLPLTFYSGGIGLITALATGRFLREAMLADVTGWTLAGVGMVFLVCASQLAVALMNWLSMQLLRPRSLPRMDFTAGIPEDCRTMVVVPTMLGSTEGVDRLIEMVEIHHLANRDDRLHFALLTDLRDAPTEHLPGDAALVARVRDGVKALNRKYGAVDDSLFFLLHRPRRWNAGEGVWMGYERKRGKLAEFNAILRGGAMDRFSETVGAMSLLGSVKYVITLDTDTQLPRESARQLVGTLAHPLNRPVFDEARGVVSEGYGILQPRVGVSLPGSRRSWFVRLFAGDAGIDPYTREVSDVYQDVFQEGSFIGKGIYDVDAFQRAMHGRFPENTVLSHDLLEACHARSALVTDVEFYEEHPSRYNVDVDRRHRWIRGDWQITQWLLPRVPGADARSISNSLSALSRWKIFDNLRRSLVPAALMALMLGHWLLLPESMGNGALLVMEIVILPSLLFALVNGFRKSSDLPWAMHLRIVLGSVGRQLAQLLLTFAFLPYDAFVSLDAIVRTLVRLLVTRQRLLEWQTSGDSEQSGSGGLGRFYAMMWIAPAVALTVGVALAAFRPEQGPGAFPVLGLWVAAPWIAWWISQPLESLEPELTRSQRTFLRHAARRTWHFFETFVTEQENWLPPDNFQEVPAPIVAPRTSPTNMGLALLSNLAALDFGYLTVGGVIRRTEDALSSMQRMERRHGHFYNWYDTRSLRPLLPLYVSSVDSGNLAGHLLTLGSGLRELPDEAIFPAKLFLGLRDSLEVLRRLVGAGEVIDRLDAELAAAPTTLRASHALLERVQGQTEALASMYAREGSPTGATEWTGILARQGSEALRELVFLAPWLLVPESGADPRVAALDATPTLRRIAALGAATEVGTLEVEDTSGVTASLREAGARARERVQRLESLAQQGDEMAAMDFTFLFDLERKLMVTGFNVTEQRFDAGFYDLLASEARLCSYVVIALGQVPQDHWFSLGRLLVAPRGEPILVSWSGSMFEYLMPLLVMPNYDGALLDHSCRAAVRQQIGYGKLRGVPWGISESGYNRTDVQLTYQYRAFGVPGLGLKRGLAEDLVIAPYATAMALMVSPNEACGNLQVLAADGRLGEYGFYEAVDYTPSRLPPGDSSVTIQSYMAHHEGMSLCSMANALLEFPMQRRFMACPALKAADLLLQERVSKTAASVLSEELRQRDSRPLAGGSESSTRVFSNPTSPSPEVHLLSNGRYHIAISSAGSGYSRWRDLAITRWREDATCDGWGTFVYLRDMATGEFWSTAHHPTGRVMKNYEAIFSQSRAEFRLRHAALDVHTEISVSPEDDVEVRRITLTNRSLITRVIELTTYAEVVLAKQDADTAHPAFSNLFVQTEFVPESSAILCTRRARSAEETPPWMTHLLVGEPGKLGKIGCETDRSRFVGRGGSTSNPAAMRDDGLLSDTVGSVLDPMVSLRRTVTLAPQETVVVALVMGVAESHEAALAQVEKYQSCRMADRVFDLAWTHSQVTLHLINATEGEAQIYGQMSGALIYADSARRASSAVLMNSRRGQNGLWSFGISGDAPIVLLRISDSDKIEIVRQLIQAHSYWRMKGLTVDLVILNEDVSVYHQSLHERITTLISSGIEAQWLDKPGGIFVRRLEQVSNEDRVLLQAAARIVLDDEKGSLAEQMGHRGVLEAVVPPLIASRFPERDLTPPIVPRELLFANGFGGFSPDGCEYVIALQPGQMTPAPWVNVLANPYFGTVVSEAGSAYTWVENSHEFRLTPWSNDAVQDPPGEALYIRDEQTGEFWSPTPLPARGATPYVIRHGFGYSVFEHQEHGIVSELWVYVAVDAPVKFSVLKLRNVSGRPRRLSVTGYWEWVLGDLRSRSLLHIQTEVDLKTGAVLARNPYHTEFSERIAFLDVNDGARTITGDRKEFIGRNGSLAQPAAMKRVRLSGKVGAGMDPCGAVQVNFHLLEGEERETTFRLGVGRGIAEVHNLIRRYRREDATRQALEGVRDHWNRTLGAVQVETPDASVNVMANGWLLYQTLSCRIWGRTGFYQSGGAFGFRDQLQDVMALVHSEPALTREHLLRAATHQFREGDVQHWWHPPTGRGVRTHFSDDFLWLPYVTCRYVSCVADTGVLDERIPFLEARPVKPDEEAYYDCPNRSEDQGTLYQHCVRAIEHGMKFGEHGLPLIGCGDWNDGLNRVGPGGRGESVWLGFFLFDVLTRFAPLARARKDVAFADRCLEVARQLQESLEANAWDGAWYRRANFDNGEPLGSQSNPECQIDSLPQSWSVISGAGEAARSREAMESVNRRLVRRESGLIQLFDPPFDRSSMNPGYIKGYIPGVRENGGQYTHAGIWTAMAFAMLGETERAWELFQMLNPVHHGDSQERIQVYKVEPYVVAADVYAVAPHTGRGGWTWYTGSAGWMYRLLVETLLGVELKGDQLVLTPRMPERWPSYTLHYRYRQTLYHIAFVRVAAGSGESGQLSVDGVATAGNGVPLVDDRREHRVEFKV